MPELKPNSTPLKIGLKISRIKVRVKAPDRKGNFSVTTPIGGGTKPYSITGQDEVKDIDLMKNGAEVTNTGKSTLDIAEIE